MNTIRSARYSTDKLSRKLPVKDNLASIHDAPRTIRKTGPENRPIRARDALAGHSRPRAGPSRKTIRKKVRPGS